MQRLKFALCAARLGSTLGMRAPRYRWTCHKCEHVNEPDTSPCSQCGFPAVASGAEIALARKEPNPTAEGYRDLGKGAGWLAWLAFLIGS